MGKRKGGKGGGGDDEMQNLHLLLFSSRCVNCWICLIDGFLSWVSNVGVFIVRMGSRWRKRTVPKFLYNGGSSLATQNNEISS